MNNIYLVPSYIFLVTIFTFSSVQAQKLNEETWNAKWINSQHAQDRTNSWTAFRKSIELDEIPVKSEIRIAVDSKYWMWINGELVVFEGGLKRGPSPNDTYYDLVDISGKLKNGENTIAILVWYFGKNGFSHHSSGKAGMVFELYNNDELVLKSDRNWQTKALTSYLQSYDGSQPNYRLSESNIIYDARNEIGPWTESDFEPKGWRRSFEVGAPPCFPWNKLLKRPIPLWKNFGLKSYQNPWIFPFISKGDTIKCKLPYNAQITPYFKIDAKSGERISMLTDNYYVGKTASLRAEYITKSGEQEYESYGWINGHEVYYIIPEGIKVLDLQFRETGFNTEFSGAFECDDPFYNQLWKKARRTLYITMRDTYMDCPERERAQWWGDAVNEFGEAFYALDPESRLLARKGIFELMNWQRADSTIFSPIPSGNYSNELPMQMLNSVGFYGFWTYFLHTGDTATIRQVYPMVKKYLYLWKIGENGLIIPRKGGWTWGDWGENKDMEILFNAWYYLASEGFELMHDMLEAKDDISQIHKNKKSIETNFNSSFWTGDEYRSPEYKLETDDRANAMAVLSGLAEHKNYPKIKLVLEKEMHASPYMEKYVIEAFFKMDYYDAAMKRLKGRFAQMVNSDLTTLWEGWDLGTGWTYNHAWSGGGLTILSQYVAGIEPILPGYDKVLIYPRKTELKMSKAKVHSVGGMIAVENYFIDKHNFSQKISSPASMDLKIIFPVETKSIKNISINGIDLSKMEFKTYKTDSSLSLAGGSYHIIVRY